MTDGAPIDIADLAAKLEINPRYLQECLSAMAAADYVTYDESTNRLRLVPEQVLTFALEDSPAFFIGAFQIIQSMWLDEPKVANAFRSGRGVGWHEHSACLFRRTGYNNHLVTDWIPALDGLSEKLAAGAKVADIGCVLSVS